MSAGCRDDVDVVFWMRLCLDAAALAYVRRFRWRRNLGLAKVSVGCCVWMCVGWCTCGWMLRVVSFAAAARLLLVEFRDLSFSYTPIVKGHP